MALSQFNAAALILFNPNYQLIFILLTIQNKRSLTNGVNNLGLIHLQESDFSFSVASITKSFISFCVTALSKEIEQEYFPSVQKASFNNSSSPFTVTLILFISFSPWYALSQTLLLLLFCLRYPQFPQSDSLLHKKDGLRLFGYWEGFLPLPILS